MYGKATESDYCIRADRSDPRLGWHQGEPIPDHSVGLIVGSPPFACGVPYSSGYDDCKSAAQVEMELAGHFCEIARVLQPGRYAFINVPLATTIAGHYFCWLEVCSRLMQTHGLEPGAPPIIVTLERGVVVEQSQRRGVRFGTGADIVVYGSLGPAQIDPKDVPDLTECARTAWHCNLWDIGFTEDLEVCVVNPAAWSREIPYRLARLASLPGELIVDPWCGSARSAAALMGGISHPDHPLEPRRFLGQDLQPQIPGAWARLRQDWANRAQPWKRAQGLRTELDRLTELFAQRTRAR